MTNVLEAVSKIYRNLLDDQPEPPMNVGEVFDVWKYLAILEEAVVLEQIARNTSTDSELLKLLDDAVGICKSQSDRLIKLMEMAGIPIPSLPGDKPKSEAEAVPMGVKMTDREIANMLAAKMLLVSKECCRSMIEAIRTDVGVLWGDFLYEQAKFGAVLKTAMRKRGWLQMPPAYTPPGIPHKD